MNWAIELAERGWLPDPMVRAGIRRLLAERLREVDQRNCAADREAHQRFIEQMRSSPVAIGAAKANEQHYEAPPNSLCALLGPRMKYSCGLWSRPGDTLATAEEAMLALTCQRADIGPGQRILDLGCGWGSLALWIAEHYPDSKVTALSNSRRQREFILARAEAANLANLEVVTRDVQDFQAPAASFDRVVSVEMFEHVRNHEALLGRIAGWLAPGGKLFVHIFCHRRFAYSFEPATNKDWMAQHFFTGGVMPSDDLLLYYQRDLAAREHHRIPGWHYARTLEAWLARLDEDREAAAAALAPGLPAHEARRLARRWRIFLMASAELFAYRGGQEWWVAHYVFENHATRAAIHSPGRSGSGSSQISLSKS